MSEVRAYKKAKNLRFVSGSFSLEAMQARLGIATHLRWSEAPIDHCEKGFWAQTSNKVQRYSRSTQVAFKLDQEML